MFAHSPRVCIQTEHKVFNFSLELSTANIIRRILHLIREEYNMLIAENGDDNDDGKLMDRTTTAMYHLLSDIPMHKSDYHLNNAHEMKPHFIQLIKELLDEVDSVYTNISSQAVEHIHSK